MSEEYADVLEREATEPLKSIGECCVCGQEIYEWEVYYDMDGEMVHEDCLEEYAISYFDNCRKAG